MTNKFKNKYYEGFYQALKKKRDGGGKQESSTERMVREANEASEKRRKKKEKKDSWFEDGGIAKSEFMKQMEELQKTVPVDLPKVPKEKKKKDSYKGIKEMLKKQK